MSSYLKTNTFTPPNLQLTLHTFLSQIHLTFQFSLPYILQKKLS